MKDGLTINIGGTKLYYLNNKYHREDGPAVEYTGGDKAWYIHDKLHREDGPAIEYDDHKEWWYYGAHITCSSQQEFEKLMKLKGFW